MTDLTTLQTPALLDMLSHETRIFLEMKELEPVNEIYLKQKSLIEALQMEIDKRKQADNVSTTSQNPTNIKYTE